MAKRKRLTAANPLFADGPAPETKSAIPPIAGVASEAASISALRELSDTLAEARASGRILLDLPHDAIQLDYLVRDRVSADPEETMALRASLAARGQQTPIEVEDLGGGRYGLISGWRRCIALSVLFNQTRETRFATVRALVRPRREAPEAYVAMIEENEIRAGLSYYERARIVLRTVERGVFDDTAAALRALFAAASRPRRSKIGSFVTVVRALDPYLQHPQAIPERLGLALAKGLEADPALAGRLAEALDRAAPEDAATELAVLQAGLRKAGGPAPRATRPPALPRSPEGAVTLSRRPDSTAVLSGPGLTPEFLDALELWLRGTE